MFSAPHPRTSVRNAVAKHRRGCPDQGRPPFRHPPSTNAMDATPGDRPTTNAKGEGPNHEQAYYTLSSDGQNRRPQPCPIARDGGVRRGSCGAPNEPAGQRTQPLRYLAVHGEGRWKAGNKADVMPGWHPPNTSYRPRALT